MMEADSAVDVRVEHRALHREVISASSHPCTSRAFKLGPEWNPSSTRMFCILVRIKAPASFSAASLALSGVTDRASARFWVSCSRRSTIAVIHSLCEPSLSLLFQNSTSSSRSCGRSVKDHALLRSTASMEGCAGWMPLALANASTTSMLVPWLLPRL